MLVIKKINKTLREADTRPRESEPLSLPVTILLVIIAVIGVGGFAFGLWMAGQSIG